MQTLNEWLRKQELLCDKAIPGPWQQTSEAGDGKEFTIEGNVDEWKRLECHVSTDDCNERAAKRTGKFIIASRLSLPTALKIIRYWSGLIHGDAAIVAVNAAEKIINEVTPCKP